MMKDTKQLNDLRIGMETILDNPLNLSILKKKSKHIAVFGTFQLKNQKPFFLLKAKQLER